MKISYKKLWVMLIEREIPKAVFGRKPSFRRVP